MINFDKDTYIFSLSPQKNMKSLCITKKLLKIFGGIR